MSKPAFSHVGLTCRDLSATERYYSRHFGFRRARVVPLGSDQIVFLKSENAYLELFQAKESSPGPNPDKDGPGYAGFRHLSFEVDDVETMIERMGRDAKITLGPLSFDDFIPGWKAVWVQDPDGRIIEINQGYKDEENPPPAP